jgi:diguanylate cyclase (GGDEF)-like protein
VKDLLNFFTKYYFICALATLVLISICGLALWGYLIKQEQISSAISTIQEQHMLTQRISSLSTQYLIRKKDVLEDLKISVQNFKENNIELNKSYDSNIIPKAKLKTIYAGTGISFNNQVEIFLTSVENFINTPLKSKKSAVYFNKVIAQSNFKLLESLKLIEAEYASYLKTEQVFLKFVHFTFFFLVTLLVTVYTFFVLRPTLHRLSANQKLLEELEFTDVLTKLANRKEFVRRGEIEVYRSRRYTRPLSLLLIDIDHFKNFNETHGHTNGDKMLVAFTECLTNNIRTIDSAGRIIGGEFAVLLPETNLAQAILLGDRLRGIIASENILKRDSKSLNITVSVGVSEVKLTNENNSIEKALKDAAVNLFFAKQAGRNLVIPEAA